jgi:hypothetical protein
VALRWTLLNLVADFWGPWFASALPLFPSDLNSFLTKFGRNSFSRYIELTLFPKGDDCADYVDDNELGDARGDALGGLRCSSHCTYQDGV